MRRIKMRHMVMAIFLMLVLLSSAGGKPRPTVDEPNGDTCMNDPTTDKNCGGNTDAGAICYCCYDDGCWICGTSPLPSDECVWDPKYRAQQEAAPLTEPLSISPESGHRLKPPRVAGTNVLTEEIKSAEQTSIAGQTGTTVINFDDLVTGGLGTGGPISVTNQYASQGVTFNGPVAIDFSKGDSISGFAHSGTIAIEQCYAAEFCTAPIEIKFNQGQSRVKVWVGYDSSLQEKTPVILRAFDSSGKQIAKASANLAEQGPIPIRIPLEVSTSNQRNKLLTRSNIARVTVDFSDNNRYTNGLAVDDVEFERGVLPDIPTTIKG